MLFKFAFILLLAAVSTSGESLYGDAKRLYDFGLGKRAYAYVSQYKRLPVYNFGLGKRAADAKSMYAFGLGKRDTTYESKADDAVDELDVEKRARGGYDFGLGKRVAAGGYNYNFELGKKATPQYSFGLGKRLGYYNFGLGKRAGKYGFGLGKKDRTYSFGLGKRYNYSPMDEDDEGFDLRQDAMEEEKRGGKFSFGLGKRENSLEELLASADDDTYALSDRQIRSPHYNFGLGKWSVELPSVDSALPPENKGNQQTSKISQ